MNNTDLLKGYAEPIEQRSIVRGYVSINRPAPTGFPVEGSEENLLWVIVPGYTLNAPLGPCRWAALHGSSLPKQGAECVVAFDEGNKPVVVFWEGPATGLVKESGVATLSGGKATVKAASCTTSSRILCNTLSGTPTAVGVTERKAGEFKLEGGSGSNEVTWAILS